MQQLKAIAKWAMSFTKRHWDIEDYPIHSYQSDGKWMFTSINWPLINGFGSTPTEAMSMLKEELAKHQAREGSLPRPGSHVPFSIEFYSTVNIEKYSSLLPEFFKIILDMDYQNVLFISDETSVFDFITQEDVVATKITEHYGIDISEIKDGNLAWIISLIHQSGSATLP